MAQSRGRFRWVLVVALAVFGVASASAVALLVPLHSFDGASGTWPQGLLVEGSDGNLYGTTALGGTFDSGTVFTLAPDGSLTTLHSFSGPDGRNPIVGLLDGTDVSFYGKTGGAGVTDSRTVFMNT
jgi:uncharacterized repeat protein (TIGR03803 family)